MPELVGGIVTLDVATIEVERGLRRKIDNWPRVLNFAMKEIATGIRYDFLATTRSWSSRPEFETLTEATPDGITVVVGTESKIYSFVDLGTRPHDIWPRNAPALSFMWGGPGSYMPKTVPGWVGSQGGGPTGNRVVRKHVHHPGTKPRDFSRLIRWRWRAAAPGIIRKYAAAWANDTTP